MFLCRFLAQAQALQDLCLRFRDRGQSEAPHLRLLLADDRLEAARELAALVMLPTPPTEASTALTTKLLRMSERKASYQELCTTSSLKASAAPVNPQLSDP